MQEGGAGDGEGAIVTLDFGHQIAQRATMEGAHVRDILDIGGRKIDWGDLGEQKGGAKGTLDLSARKCKCLASRAAAGSRVRGGRWKFCIRGGVG